MEATPTRNPLRFRAGDFSTLAEALDYAAQGTTGYNFYSGRGELQAVLPYADLRREAHALARRLLSLGLQPGERVALVAETSPYFLRFFFACQYADLIPVPLPVSINLGSRKAYERQLHGLLENCRASIAIASTDVMPLLREAAEGLKLRFLGTPAEFEDLDEGTCGLRLPASTSIAYIQYTSGSTRFPRGVTIPQSAVLNNLAGIIEHGVELRAGDRSVSWLPFYHDMGLVGLVLAPVAAQLSADYLGTREFAMRPRQWLSLMARNHATISFSPPFGYELCARRVRQEEMSDLDLSAWRIAGVGAETIRPEPLSRFATALAPTGFDKRAFLACYGMAECSLAVSFAGLSQGLQVDYVNGERLAECKEAEVAETGRLSQFVDCGQPLPTYDVEIRNERGEPLSERRVGTIFVRGPSVMAGYFNDASESGKTLSADGWLNTGDVGYRAGGRLIVTGREKDLIIINGRNIWPQDLEYLAEQQPEVRPGDALAFSAPGWGNEETTVLVVQCRETDKAKRAEIVARLQGLVREELAIECFVELVPLHTLPRTSSGKLSRSGARNNFFASRNNGEQPFNHPQRREREVARKAG